MSKILLIEDDTFIRELYERELENAGYTVISSVNGEEGLEKFNQEKPDMVLLDILLPGISGLDVLKKIQAANNLGKSIILLLTNLGQESIIKQGFAFGAAGYLIKSAQTPQSLLRQINEFFGKKG